MNWIAHFFGLDNGSGISYLFWSGVGSDISEIAILGALWGVIRRHNCDVRGCWRFGILPTLRDGVQHHVCRRHHPSIPTANQISAGGNVQAEMLEEIRKLRAVVSGPPQDMAARMRSYLTDDDRRWLTTQGWVDTTGSVAPAKAGATDA